MCSGVSACDDADRASPRTAMRRRRREKIPTLHQRARSAKCPSPVGHRHVARSMKSPGRTRYAFGLFASGGSVPSISLRTLVSRRLRSAMIARSELVSSSSLRSAIGPR